MPRMAPWVRMWRTSWRVSMPSMPTMPLFLRYSSSVAPLRQLLG